MCRPSASRHTGKVTPLPGKGHPGAALLRQDLRQGQLLTLDHIDNIDPPPGWVFTPANRRRLLRHLLAAVEAHRLEGGVTDEPSQVP